MIGTHLFAHTGCVLNWMTRGGGVPARVATAERSSGLLTAVIAGIVAITAAVAPHFPAAARDNAAAVQMAEFAGDHSAVRRPPS